MFTRTRFQSGSLTKEKRKRHADIWIYRWREEDPNGSIIRRKMIVGTVDKYRTKSLAKKALDALGMKINETHPQGSHPALMTMGQLIQHYENEELGEQRLSKTQSTVDVYREFLRYWIAPRWKNQRPLEVRPTDVEAWLRTLTLADGTKAKIRNIMSAIFQHGLRHQFISVNPIRGLVRQSAKRQREPEVLTALEIGAILKLLSARDRCLVFLAAATGLRFSELRGLQWQDVDFKSGVLYLRRGVVKNHVTELKTKASRKPVPLDSALVEILASNRVLSPYNQPSDWVFASVKAKGRVPIWPSALMSDHVLPAVRAAEIQKHVSWHTFRHSYATLLKGNGEDVKVVQESLRHATFQITMNTYTQAIPQAVRSAHSKVVGQIEAGSFLTTGPGLDPGSIGQAVSD